METLKSLRTLLDTQTHLAKSLASDLEAACVEIRRLETECQGLRNHPVFQKSHFETMSEREQRNMNLGLSGSVDVIDDVTETTK